MAGEAIPGRRRILLERKYRTTIDRLWDLWTTKNGIELWWGPEGFEVSVAELDLRPGGKLKFTMTAVGQEQIEALKKAGLSLAVDARATYTVVEKKRRLGFKTVADFIPGVEPYEVETIVDFIIERDEVLMLVSFDPMHDEVWTERQRMGRESELARLDLILSWPRQ